EYKKASESEACIGTTNAIILFNFYLPCYDCSFPNHFPFFLFFYMQDPFHNKIKNKRKHNDRNICPDTERYQKNDQEPKERYQ
ncbi:hypothetical protein, partial [Klebsiella pneumoniae]